MSRRQIGQEHFSFASQASRQAFGIDEIDALVDWSAVDETLRPIYACAKGEQAWPPLAMFKALLLSIWYDLSDPKLAEALDDRASFRRFCGFSRTEPTPERTAFVRFRKELVSRQLDQTLFEAITRQLQAKRVRLKHGTLIDATVIASASHDDKEAGWSGHAKRKAIHGFKAHVTADADDATVETLSVTPGNVHDGKAGAEIVPDEPGTVYADSAYRGSRFADAVRAKGGRPAVAATGYWAREGDVEAARRFAEAMGAIHRVRGRIEKIFGTWKRSYGLRRMRWRGLAKCQLQVSLTATAYNLRRCLTILRTA